ncbi:MAG: dihydroneopterin aldolase [Opitutales bacterium]|nr:dihydroneopterin aldolase [Opitutales bacterium]
MRNSIFLNDLEFFGTHGVYSLEHNCKQRFLVSIEMEGNFSKAAQTDNLEDTINYSTTYKIVQKIIETQHFNLIETLADNIAHTILDEFKSVHAVTVIVKKFPATWVDRNYGNVGVKTTITR